MGDKKKRALSALDKALMIAHNYQYRTAANLKEFKEETRRKYRAFSANIGASGPPGTPIHRTEQNAACYDDIFNGDLAIDYATAVRCLLLGYWDEHRIVYRVPKETTQFLEDVLKIEHWNAELTSVIKAACCKPIYIEIEGQGAYHGHFVGLCSLANKGLPRMKDEDILFSSIAVDEVSSFVNVAYYAQQTVSRFFRESDDRISDVGATEEQCALFNQMMRTLMYIGFLNKMNDALGNALIKDNSKSYDRYTVLPIPYEDSIPNFELTGGWISSGLCNQFGYISRKHMREDFAREIKLSGSEWNKPLAVSNTKPQDIDAVALFVKEAILRWEDHKTVFQYDGLTEFKLYQQLSAEESMLTIPGELAKYMPYESIVLSRHDNGNICIVCPCLIEDDGKVRREFMLFNIGGTGDFSFLILPIDNEGPVCFSHDKHGMPNLAATTAYVVFYHILSVYQKKAQKRLVKELMEQGRPTSTGLIPVEEYTPRSMDPNKAEDDSNIRMGYSMSDDFFELHDVTVRTVKRVPRKEAVQRTGWKMRPHARRAHPHRYWVGKGQNKHLEVRHLGEMRINCKNEPTPDTVIHEIA